jgi:hypothetical protein
MPEKITEQQIAELERLEEACRASGDDERDYGDYAAAAIDALPALLAERRELRAKAELLGRVLEVLRKAQGVLARPCSLRDTLDRLLGELPPPPQP